MDSDRNKQTPQQDRFAQVQKDLDKWRQEARPASGSKGYLMPKAGKPKPNMQKPAPQPQPEPEEPPKNRPGTSVTIEMKPFVRYALFALLGILLLYALITAVRAFLPTFYRLTGRQTAQITAGTAAPTVDPLATPVLATPAPSPSDVEMLPESDRPVFEGEMFTVTRRVIDGSACHVLSFTSDAGNVFIPQLSRSYSISGGACEIVIDDSEWFDDSPSDDAVCHAVLRPTLTKLNGEETELEEITFDVPVPESPAVLVKPETGYEEVQVALYTVKVNVTPGSTVIVDGSDMSDFVDKHGQLSFNKTVEPIGNNIIRMTVAAPGHKETDVSINLYRPAFEIPLELDINTVENTSTAKFTLSGTFSGAQEVKIEPSVSESEVDYAAGTFRFSTKLAAVGDTTFTVTASCEGKKPSVITHTVNYMPGEDEYTSRAWKMDYDGLYNNSEFWRGRIFLCHGTVTDIRKDDSTGGSEVLLLNCGSNADPQMVCILNYSSVTPEIGKSYRMYADMEGLLLGYPLLNARYVYAD